MTKQTHTPSTTRRRAAAIAVLALAAGATVAGVAANAAMADDPKPPKQVTEELVLFEPFDEGTTAEVDNGEPGFGPGDLILEHHPVLDPATGEQVGAVVREIVVVELLPEDDFLFTVDVNVTLGEGQIQYSGATRFSEVAAGTATVPVVGGTGAYAHTTGVATGELGELDGSPGLHLTLSVTRSR